MNAMEQTSQPKVVVALSGGVDSSVAAALMLQEHYEVILATLDMTPSDPEFRAAWSCGGDARTAVEEVARKFNLEPHFLSEYDRFAERVLKPCFDAYENARTPNPCTLCNPALKFGLLLEFAESVGAEKLITGHYAAFGNFEGERLIRRGSDRNKDQSYFLYRLTREMLDRIEFPVGMMQKNEVRKIAAELALPTASRPDSQDACFAFPGETFQMTLHRIFHGRTKRGCFVYQGKKVGEHQGIHRYTIGQRKGLNVALGVPAYIRSIDAASGEIELVTDQSYLECQRFLVGALNWQCRNLPLHRKFDVQIRYRTPAAPGTLELHENGTATVILDAPQRAVTPGQAAVFYCDGFLMGGGVIETLLDAK